MAWLEFTDRGRIVPRCNKTEHTHPLKQGQARDLREEIRRRREEARSMRRSLAAWVIEGVPPRQMDREWRKLQTFERDTDFMEDMLTDESRPAGMLQIGFVREEETA